MTQQERDAVFKEAQKLSAEVYEQTPGFPSEREWPALCAAKGYLKGYNSGYEQGQKSERERILGLLRRESFYCDEPNPVRTGIQWANWLESELKK